MPGMTLRQYAAIKLRVPNSGIDWLDEMIRESMRDEVAAKAMQGMLSDADYDPSTAELAKGSYIVAEAMFAARSAS